MLPRQKKLSLQPSILIPRWVGAEYVGDRTPRQVTRSHIPDADGWVTPDLPFELFNEARTHLLGLGRAVEVLEPETLRKCLIDFSEQTIDFYENKKGQDDWIGIFFLIPYPEGSSCTSLNFFDDARCIDINQTAIRLVAE